MDRGHPRYFGDVECVLGELVAEFDPGAVPLCEASRLWETLAGCARLVASAQMLLAPRVEESGEWQRKGFYCGWALIEGEGRREMVPPDDPRHPKNKPK